ncbi:hypothetical protein E6Q11_04260 [Candidatus Dojkabacteria bacterium]|uniref:Uncharacterized protein n=1 Tax=Candidatus Dojkabacteria bacterium TaxID=2099670 RepID=A0A5C7J501_9BACT|nr:MAG: hypothetical protein E6Q11_04260 [Candidatus Dojkabacteria bacterium]
MAPKYPKGVFATRSEHSPSNLVTYINIDLVELQGFIVQNPEIVQNNSLKLIVWTDENGIHYVTIDSIKKHPGYYDPAKYEHPTR